MGQFNDWGSLCSNHKGEPGESPLRVFPFTILINASLFKMIVYFIPVFTSLSSKSSQADDKFVVGQYDRSTYLGGFVSENEGGGGGVKSGEDPSLET